MEEIEVLQVAIDYSIVKKTASSVTGMAANAIIIGIIPSPNTANGSQQSGTYKRRVPIPNNPAAIVLTTNFLSINAVITKPTNGSVMR